jgi:phage baseplate assembly protein W
MTTGVSNIRARTKPYSDFDFVFQKHPITGDVPIKRDVEAVKQSVRNILLTRRGEKFFDPDFGGSLTEFLFENFDPVVEAEIEQRIRGTLANYEPRVKVLGLEIEDLSHRNALSLNLEVQILSPENNIVNIEFIIERLR